VDKPLSTEPLKYPPRNVVAFSNHPTSSTTAATTARGHDPAMECVRNYAVTPDRRSQKPLSRAVQLTLPLMLQQPRVSIPYQDFLESYETRFRSAPFAHSLNTFFFTFPVLVLGSSSTISTSRGTMNLLILLECLAQSITSSPLSCFPCLIVMKALGLSPQWESATATQAASRISGCVTSMDSNATDEMFSPPVRPH
jgi:hypothetical protein